MSAKAGRAFGENVQRAREQKGLSRAYVSERSNTSEDYLVSIETGEHDVRLSVAAAIAQVLNVEVKSLYRGI